MDYRQIADSQNLRFDCIEFAQWLDNNDPLGWLREEFDHPTFECLEKMTTISITPKEKRSGNTVTYLCGNSLGLPPKKLANVLQDTIQNWSGLGVHAYMHGPLPASLCDITLTEDIANYIVGAETDEVAVTANLSVNMHMLLATFYRPEGTKSCIVIEKGAFPSDYYVIESQIAWHGLDPKDNIIMLEPRPGDWCLRMEDIVQTIKDNSHRIALIWLPGVQFITGQVFDIECITEAGHKFAQCCVGWDLAHSVGNVVLELHKWNVDIAVWCSYKYLNGSPGALGGLFVHRRHHHLPGINGSRISSPGITPTGPQLTGWWSHRIETRFQMTGNMELATGAQAYRISNPPLLLAAALKTSVDLFKRCGGLGELRKKSVLLTGYLEYLIEHGQFCLPTTLFKIVTPKDKEARGAQLTLFVKKNLQQLYDGLASEGIIVDTRPPNCIRIAPVPLYNRFIDVFNFARQLHSLVSKLPISN
ncbi:hypothetical protein CRM22_010133 [Opisthorchis felineus]|uniref:Kynureninase n=1 Tax=Opisthorchis felineus TaxID=147828 RepID=A0A4V3SCE1_OPIFE|nr:hypothetical protein CRM22_010133 [Opisthorchis felineus]